jgi:hypothetical protein
MITPRPAQRGSKRNLPLADGSARQQKIGGVRATDQQNERYRTQQQQEVRPHVAYLAIAQWDDARPAVLIVLRVLTGQSFGDARQVGLCLRDAYSGLKPCDHAVNARVAPFTEWQPAQRGVVTFHRRPDLRAVPKGEVGRHDADHRQCRLVRLDGAPHDLAIAAKAVLAKPVADQRLVHIPAGPVFLEKKKAADYRRRPENRQRLRLELRGFDRLRQAVAVKVGIEGARVCPQLHEGAVAPAEVVDVEQGAAADCAGVAEGTLDAHQALGLPVGGAGAEGCRR